MNTGFAVARNIKRNPRHFCLVAGVSSYHAKYRATPNEISEKIKILMATRLLDFGISGCRNIVKSFHAKAAIINKTTI